MPCPVRAPRAISCARGLEGGVLRESAQRRDPRCARCSSVSSGLPHLVARGLRVRGFAGAGRAWCVPARRAVCGPTLNVGQHPRNRAGAASVAKWQCPLAGRGNSNSDRSVLGPLRDAGRRPTRRKRATIRPWMPRSTRAARRPSVRAAFLRVHRLAVCPVVQARRVRCFVGTWARLVRPGPTRPGAPRAWVPGTLARRSGTRG
jgi:hypothetical protein